MACRKGLFLALSLMCAAAGCGPERTLPVVPPIAEPIPETRRESNLPKRTPKASTCVKFGAYGERAAAEPSKSAAERDQLFQQAGAAYQQALSIDPKCLPAFQGLARVYTERGNYPLALETYQKALKAYPKEAALWFDLGMCHARQKQWDPALESLRTAVTLTPDNAHYVTTLGFCLARAGRFDESFAVFQKHEGEAKAHYHLAGMLYHLGQDELCQQHLQLALQKEPGLAPAYELLVQLRGGGLNAPNAAVQVKYETPAQPPK